MSPLELLQTDSGARLEADPFFADIAVFVVRPRGSEGFAEIETKKNAALAGLVATGGKRGMAVQVLMPLCDGRDPNAPGPLLDFTITVRVQEHVAVNMGADGTQKSAEEVALKALQLLHHFSPGRGNVLVADTDAVTPSDAFKPLLTYDVRLVQRTGLAQVAKVARPAISAAGLTVTLTCATAGAAIYYTTDESYPSSANAAATLYATPFTLATAATVRTAAEKTDLLQSDIVQSSIS